jgi:hypothetical protein
VIIGEAADDLKQRNAAINLHFAFEQRHVNDKVSVKIAIITDAGEGWRHCYQVKDI